MSCPRRGARAFKVTEEIKNLLDETLARDVGPCSRTVGKVQIQKGSGGYIKTDTHPVGVRDIEDEEHPSLVSKRFASASELSGCMRVVGESEVTLNV